MNELHPPDRAVLKVLGAGEVLEKEMGVVAALAREICPEAADELRSRVGVERSITRLDRQGLVGRTGGYLSPRYEATRRGQTILNGLE